MDHLLTYPVQDLITRDGLDARSKGDIQVDDDVWIGCNAMILSGVHIHQGAVVAAGAIVTKDVPPYGIVAGVPAKLVGYRFEEELREKLLDIDFGRIDETFIRTHKELFVNDSSKFAAHIDELPRKTGGK